MRQLSQVNLSQEFVAGCAKSKGKKKPRTIPISVRVTAEEKARLKKKAGSMALAHFIRLRALGDDAEVRPKKYQQKPYQPKVDYVELARILGQLGQSELATSMLALSLAAQAGELDVSDKVESKLERACDDIHELKVALIMALNIKPQGG